MLAKLLLFLVLIVHQVCIWTMQMALPSVVLFDKFVRHQTFYSSLSTGDTFTDGTVKYTMTSMNVPEPVMSLAVSPISKDSGGQVYHLLNKNELLLYVD